MKKLEEVIKKIIFNSKDLNEMVEVISEFNQEGLRFNILKSPRWSDDAVIVKALYDNAAYTIKIHYDKYPLACHMYNSPKLIEKLRQCRYITHIYNSFVINNNGQNIRCVIYPFVNGETLEKRLQKSEESDLPYLRSMLKKCTIELFRFGVNPFIRDLADFIVTNDNNEEIVVLTDYNALMDCHNATLESREEIMTIMDTVIEKIIDKQYKPFISVRPTLTDLQ